MTETAKVLKLNAPTKPKRAKVDWEAIEPHYRAGIRSLRDISNEFNVTNPAVIKHAKLHKWTRDLTAKIKARTDLKLSEAMVSKEVSALTKVTEEIRIEVESQVQSRIVITHRADINRFRALVIKLLGEVEVQTDHPGEFAELAEIIIWKDAGEVQTKDEVRRMERMQQLFNMVMSNPGRVDSMKKLADTLKTLIGLEREAFGLDKGINKDMSIGELLDSMS